jgi:hypothetical protein
MVKASKEKPGYLNERAIKTTYSIRAIRYWWTHCCILDELKNKNKLNIVDIGCSTGKFKEYVGDIPECVFTGIDWDINKEILSSLGYTNCIQSDLAEKKL